MYRKTPQKYIFKNQLKKSLKYTRNTQHLEHNFSTQFFLNGSRILIQRNADENSDVLGLVQCFLG